MTVGELIELLKKENPAAKAIRATSEGCIGDYWDVDGLKARKVIECVGVKEYLVTDGREEEIQAVEIW